MRRPVAPGCRIPANLPSQWHLRPTSPPCPRNNRALQPGHEPYAWPLKMSEQPAPIDCTIHDHLEVACLFAYSLEVRTRDGGKLTGRAADTRTVAGGQEFLVLATESGETDISMHEIAEVTVLTPGARFRHLTFPDPA